MTLLDKIDRAILRNMKVEHETINRTPDHIEIGSASKGGVIKVYGDFNKPDEFKLKIDAALRLKEYANSKMYPPSKE